MEVRIIRSPRRKKTFSARMVGGVLVVRSPQKVSPGELEKVVSSFKERAGRKREGGIPDSGRLKKRAEILNHRYFSGALKIESLKYVDNQKKRFGSCSCKKGVIRISSRVAKFPLYVRDYLLVHELAHLLKANHSRKFWSLVSRFPKTERARGYLEAAGKNWEHCGCP